MSPFTLTLSPAWGGTAFGPFSGTAVQLGSDAGQCQITLPAEHGVHPIHAVVWAAADGSFGMQPGAQGAGLYLFREGGGMAHPVTAPVQLRLGDAFAIGRPDGPRFTVGRMAAQPSPAGGGKKRGFSPGAVLPSQDALQREVRRQVTSRLGSGPLAGLSTLLVQLRSGQLMQPRYIFGAIVVLAAGCAGVVQTMLN